MLLYMLTQYKLGSMLPLCFANIPTRASRFKE